jgi:hypothetical protein
VEKGRQYVIASCSIGLGLIAGIGVLLVTTLEWVHVENAPQLPTVLFFVALGLLAYGCHCLDCWEDNERHR